MPPFISPRGVGALLAAIACTFVVAGCGGSESASDGSSSSAGAANSSNQQDAARVRLQNCLREQGVDLPEDGGGQGQPPDIEGDELENAMEACDEYRDEAFGDITEQDQQEMQDAFAKFSQCMRDEGVDVPDVNFGSGDGPPAGGNQLDQNDPDVQDGLEKCQDELPQGGGGFGGP